jgi:hypothetical protein
MPQQHAYTSALYSLDTPRAEFQVVTTCDHLVLDVQARNYATDGRERREYALVHMNLADARKLYRLLAEAIAASQDLPDPRQSSLWSNATTATVGDEMRRGRLS